jgi:hypothetical protein
MPAHWQKPRSRSLVKTGWVRYLARVRETGLGGGLHGGSEVRLQVLANEAPLGPDWVRLGGSCVTVYFCLERRNASGPRAALSGQRAEPAVTELDRLAMNSPPGSAVPNSHDGSDG